MSAMQRAAQWERMFRKSGRGEAKGLKAQMCLAYTARLHLHLKKKNLLCPSSASLWTLSHHHSLRGAHQKAGMLRAAGGKPERSLTAEAFTEEAEGRQREEDSCPKPNLSSCTCLKHYHTTDEGLCFTYHRDNLCEQFDARLSDRHEDWFGMWDSGLVSTQSVDFLSGKRRKITNRKSWNSPVFRCRRLSRSLMAALKRLASSSLAKFRPIWHVWEGTRRATVIKITS